MAKTRRRQRSGGKVIAIIIAVVMLLAVGGCAGAWGAGFALTGVANPTKWETLKPATSTTPQTVAITGDGQPMASGGTYEMPTGFSFLSTRASNIEYAAGGEITLTAELDNEYINGKFDFTADFANPSATWAQGKVASYYVGLEPIEDGRQVKVKYLEPFAEQIVLTATLQGSDSSDSCTIDCVKPVTMTSVKCYATDFGDSLDFTTEIKYGIGTVEGYFEFEHASIFIEEDFIAAFKNYLNFDITVKPYVINQENYEFKTRINEKVTYEPVKSLVIDYSMFIVGFDDYDQDHKDAIYYAWYQAWQNNQYNTLLDFDAKYLFAGFEINSLSDEAVIGGYLNGDAYAYGVSPSVTLNKNIVF